MCKCQLLAALSFLLLPIGASATEPPQMKMISQWSGPFDGTMITKYADYSEGVACYVYAPKSIGLTLERNLLGSASTSIRFNGDIGSISCVKVVDRTKKK